VQPEVRQQQQQRLRVVAQRGKSMEELRAWKLARPSAMSRSSEQLDRLWRDPPRAAGPAGPAGRHHGGERSLPVFAGEAQGRDRERREPTGTERAGQEPEVGGQRSTRGPTQKRSPLKENSEPGVDATAATKSWSSSASPASCCSSRSRVQSGSRCPVADELGSGRRPGETSADPPSPGGLETRDGAIRSTASTRTEPPSAG